MKNQDKFLFVTSDNGKTIFKVDPKTDEKIKLTKGQFEKEVQRQLGEDVE